MDSDEYDKHYKNLFLWDDKELEIVGAYRIGICNEIYEKHGMKGFYTSNFFDLSENFIKNYLPKSIEVGRSFIQRKYWNTFSLDYLWQGIGALLSILPSIKYMYGSVSISNNYNDDVKRILVYFFSKWFKDEDLLAKAKNRFVIDSQYDIELTKLFNSEKYNDDLKKLKIILKQYGFSIPPLYKHYSDLCNEGGIRFIDFCIDKSFGNCIDGLIHVSIDLIKESKKERYLKYNTEENSNIAVNF
jgi:hypothetical protein